MNKEIKRASSKNNIIETEVAIKFIKDVFERELARNLNLTRVSAPLFVFPESATNKIRYKKSWSMPSTVMPEEWIRAERSVIEVA